MRISTSTMYEQQIAQIDNLAAQQEQYAAEASSGIALNAPSDNPGQIAQDLAIRTSIAQENQSSSNIQSASSQLTTIDGALSTLSSIVSSARNIAVQAAGGYTSSTQLQALASQVDGYLQEAIGLANTKYADKYVFAGTAAPSSPPVSANGSPASSINFNGNLATQTQQLSSGQSVATSVTMQQAFNYQSANGSPDVFQMLIALRNTLTNPTVTSESAARVNNANTAFTPATAINTAGVLSTPLTPDSNGNANIAITSTVNGVTNTTQITIPANATMSAVLTAINAASGTTGVTASFNYTQQRLTLSSPTGAFQVTDVASAGASTPGNFVEAFGLQSNANLQNDVSRQLGDIDNVMQSVLNARSVVGTNLQTLGAVGNAVSSQVVNDTKVQSGIEDADTAKVVTQFTQTQTALQAAYATTSRLESKSLFDYLP
jgi:flagellar hook-associated protein 3 FlgL